MMRVWVCVGVVWRDGHGHDAGVPLSSELVIVRPDTHCQVPHQLSSKDHLLLDPLYHRIR